VTNSEHTFLFADLAGFTALTEAHGDEEAAALAERFCGAVADLVDDYRAEQIKTIGDAVMVRASDAAEAVSLGLRLVRDVGEGHGALSIRVGMHTGPAIEREGDWFGTTVNTAARVSGAAGGGEVLLTEATRDAAGEVDAVVFEERGEREFKNLSEPIALYAATPRARADEGPLPTDPVCRMAVSPERAVGHLTFEGREYHFCSLECVAVFAAAPERHTRADDS
jgi:adenylate cyclase